MDMAALFSVGLQMWSCASVRCLSASPSQTGKPATSVNEMQALGAKREGLFNSNNTLSPHACLFLASHPFLRPPRLPRLLFGHIRVLGAVETVFTQLKRSFQNQLETLMMKNVVLILERDWQRVDRTRRFWGHS